jgi:hypothetical protein
MTDLDTAPHIRPNVALDLLPENAGDCAPDAAVDVTAHDKAALSLDDLESRMCLWPVALPPTSANS